ncbi:MAG: hypothetical protein PHQ75_10520 [Thermoguttaceae bacterium]|nr:hypothetical protein [Thermoguttaceae bacterium]
MRKIICVPILLLTMLILFPATLSAQESAENMINTLMRKYQKECSVADLTPTLCVLAGIKSPAKCESRPIKQVVAIGQERFGKTGAEKILVFCPDAIGHFLRPQFPADFKPLVECTDFLAEGTNVMPSVTPVCFGSIFTGASPKVHGIEKYSKPVLKIPTLFDAFAAQKKNVAILAVTGCSIDMIFRDRPVDYFSVRSNAVAFELTKIILQKSDYDLIICYDGGYDSTMHRTGIHSEASLEAMRDSLRRYQELVQLTDQVWKKYNRVTVFAPDHGAHNNKNGRGGHGTDTPDDILVDHYYRLRSR